MSSALWNVVAADVVLSSEPPLINSAVVLLKGRHRCIEEVTHSGSSGSTKVPESLSPKAEVATAAQALWDNLQVDVSSEEESEAQVDGRVGCCSDSGSSGSRSACSTNTCWEDLDGSDGRSRASSSRSRRMEDVELDEDSPSDDSDPEVGLQQALAPKVQHFSPSHELTWSIASSCLVEAAARTSVTNRGVAWRAAADCLEGRGTCGAWLLPAPGRDVIEVEEGIHGLVRWPLHIERAGGAEDEWAPQLAYKVSERSALKMSL